MIIALWFAAMIVIQIIEHRRHNSYKKLTKEGILKSNKVLVSLRGFFAETDEINAKIKDVNDYLLDVIDRLNKAGL